MYNFRENDVPEIREGAFSHVMDYKSQLQELVQRDGNGVLEYKILQERGPAHNKEFVSRVSLNGEELGVGIGRSKKRQNNAPHKWH